MTPDLPNIRSCIIPDKGKILVEIDLKQADAQVVAWEAQDDTLKSLLRRGMDIYTEHETGVWNDPGLPALRQTRKNCVHSVNYGAGYRTLAERYVGTERAAKQFIARWFEYHPGIRRNFHERITWEMQQSLTPTIRNVFGYRRVYACATPITQPLAWIGQSTVAIVNKIMLKAYDTGRAPPSINSTANEILRWYTDEKIADRVLVDIIDVGMPHHDSALLQVSKQECPDCFPRLLELAAIPIPYPDPLIIPAELKYSERSWGHMQKWEPINDRSTHNQIARHPALAAAL